MRRRGGDRGCMCGGGHQLGYGERGGVRTRGKRKRGMDARFGQGSGGCGGVHARLEHKNAIVSTGQRCVTALAGGRDPQQGCDVDLRGVEENVSTGSARKSI